MCFISVDCLEPELMTECLILQPPFCAENRKRTIDKILRSKLVFPGYITVDAKDLIKRVSPCLITSLALLATLAHVN